MNTQSQYEANERRLLTAQLARNDTLSLEDRKAYQADTLELMREPHIVARNLEFIENGDYGFGAQVRYREIVANKRCNREAQVMQLLAALDCNCSQAHCIAAWKQLSPDEQKCLSTMIRGVWEEQALVNKVCGVQS